MLTRPVVAEARDLTAGMHVCPIGEAEPLQGPCKHRRQEILVGCKRRASRETHSSVLTERRDKLFQFHRLLPSCA
jgi:hypothetical protein